MAERAKKPKKASHRSEIICPECHKRLIVSEFVECVEKPVPGKYRSTYKVEIDRQAEMNFDE